MDQIIGALFCFALSCWIMYAAGKFTLWAIKNSNTPVRDVATGVVFILVGVSFAFFTFNLGLA